MTQNGSVSFPVSAPADRVRSYTRLLPSSGITACTLCYCCFYLVQIGLRNHASRQHFSHEFVDQSGKKVDLCAFRWSIFASSIDVHIVCLPTVTKLSKSLRQTDNRDQRVARAPVSKYMGLNVVKA
jgi:hypothetical protein